MGRNQLKKELSSKKETTINLPYITADQSGPKHLEEKITRSKFEGMIDGLLERTLHILDNALTEAKVSPKDVNQVVLVGGSTRIPKVKELMEEKISGKINKGINPGEVVAVGAAIQGGILGGEVEDIVLLDVTPLTLSIETLGGVATPLIEKNTTIPTEKTKTFSTASDNQTTVDIHVVQGERKMAQGNKSLGRFQLTGIPPAPRGVPKIDVSFSIDADGILSVTAEDKGTKKSENITLREPTRLTDEEIERMKKEAEEHEEEDKEKMEEIETRNEADQLIYSVNKSLRELGDQVRESKRKEIKDKVTDLQELVDKEAPPSEIRQVMEELSEASHQLAQQAYKQASEAGEKSPETVQKVDEDQYVDAEYEEEEE